MRLLQYSLMGLIVLGGVALFGGQAMAAPEKVVVCHIPPGNPANYHTIIVGKAAVRAHLAHGDTRGEPCDFDGDGDNDDVWSMVTLCHIPPGNPANEHTITVGAPATPAHLAHGDYLGPCGDDPPDPVCGDGVVDEGEECDPPGRINDDFVCNEICLEVFDPLFE